MDKNSKILIQGGYGFRNWGDDLQLWNNVRILKEKGYKDITVMSPSDYIGKMCDTKITQSTHSIYPKVVRGNDTFLFQQFCLIDGSLKNNRLSLLGKKQQRLIETIKKCDVFFFSGSGTINTRHCYGLMIFLTPVMIAHHLNKTIIMSGQGFTPMNNTKLEKFIGGVIGNSDKIFTRDFAEGLRALRKTNIDMDKVVVGIDDAFTSPAGKVDLPKNTIGINFSCFIVPRIQKELYELAVLLKKNKYNPIFNYFQNEKRLEESTTKGDFPIHYFDSPKNVVGFHKACSGVVSMRYHSMILSLAQQTPVVNISRDEYQYSKVKAIINETKIENLGISFPETTRDSLYSILMKAIETQPTKLKEINDKWRPKGNLAIKYLEGLE